MPRVPLTELPIPKKSFWKITTIQPYQREKLREYRREPQLDQTESPPKQTGLRERKLLINRFKCKTPSSWSQRTIIEEDEKAIPSSSSVCTLWGTRWLYGEGDTWRQVLAREFDVAARRSRRTLEPLSTLTWTKQIHCYRLAESLQFSESCVLVTPLPI